MPTPQFEVYPLRPAVRADGPTTLDVLLRVLPAIPDSVGERPALNLGLVLDRSGSMSGNGKLNYAIAAVRTLVEQLTPRDRVSLTIFDDDVQTLAGSAMVHDRQRLLDLLPSIQPGGSTALHAAWREGLAQVRPHVQAQALDRVLVLTDGLANVGEVNPDVIATEVKQASLQGVGTSTLGVGADYNEDLLEAMARSGDGNYYYIQAPDQLPAMFQTELLGLLALVGRQARLSVETAPGVVLTDVLNDLERNAAGELVLPNLIGGLPVEIVLRFTVQPGAESAPLARFHVVFESPSDGLQTLDQELSLPAVEQSAWEALPAHPDVLERGVLQLAGRVKRQMARHLDNYEVDEARTLLRQTRESLESLPPTERVEQERRDLREIESYLEQGDIGSSRKSSTSQHYRRSHSKR